MSSTEIIRAASPASLMTTAEVAAGLGITVDGVQALISRGQLKTMKAGRDHLISIEEFRRVKARPDRRKTKLLPGRKAGAKTIRRRSASD